MKPPLALLLALTSFAACAQSLPRGDCAAPAAAHDLNGCDFSGRDLAGIDLRGAFLDNASFAGARLDGARFDKASARWVNFRGAQLKAAQFPDADLFHAKFDGADLSDANLQRSYLFGSNLIGTPRQVADRHVPVLTFLLLLLAYAVVTVERISLCVHSGMETCR